MDIQKLESEIRGKVQKEELNYAAYEKYWQLMNNILNEDKGEGIKGLKWLSETITGRMGEFVGHGSLIHDMMYLHQQTLIAAGKDDFDSFMLAIEFNRKPSEQFWRPRRKLLMPECMALQDLEDDKLDELFLSQPPRTGKTTLAMMFLLWVMGKNSERSNLYSSFTAIVVDTFFNGLLEVLKDPVTYAYGDVFPGKQIIGTNAKDATLDLDRRKRYHSFTGRPIGGSLNGSCDSNGYIIGDDLCSGIEEALSKDRMASLWSKVDNNFLTRAKEGCKRLWWGTRWSLLDPQGIRLDLLQNDSQYKDVRWKCINLPALNENGDSNFDYGYGVGFSTGYYLKRRASFERNNDMASWLAQYQGQPIERDGAVFSPDDLRYYNGELPDADPDRVFLVLDPAWGGGDFVSGPVVKQYGNDLYIVDVVYDNGDKRVTQPLVVRKIKEHGVQALYVEATKTTRSYAEEVDALLRAEGIRINIQTTTKHFTGTGKEQRIFDKAPEIREKMLFLESGKRSKAYELFMQNVFSFAIGRKNVHDDAPDSLAMTIVMAIFGYMNRVEIIKRPF